MDIAWATLRGPHRLAVNIVLLPFVDPLKQFIKPSTYLEILEFTTLPSSPDTASRMRRDWRQTEQDCQL